MKRSRDNKFRHNSSNSWPYRKSIKGAIAEYESGGFSLNQEQSVHKPESALKTEGALEKATCRKHKISLKSSRLTSVFSFCFEEYLL